MLKRLFQKKSLPTNEPPQFIPWAIQQQLITTQAATIVDIGAHLGETTQLLLQAFPNASIHSIEPFQDSFLQLKQSFSQQKNVFPHQLAISNVNGFASLNVNEFLQTNSLLSSNKVHASIDDLTSMKATQQVATQTLDSFVAEQNIEKIDLLKIDAQGLTYEILEGAGCLLAEKRIQLIYAEVEFIEIYKGEKRFAEIEMLLRSKGYQFMQFFNLNNVATKQLAWADAVFVPHHSIHE